jgi:hypothetical protein
MLAFKLGWFMPHRAGGLRRWFFDGAVGHHDAAPTWWFSVCLVGFTVEAEWGWGGWVDDEAVR